jgi:Fe2+ or Zn2+ uptake regulation protein
VRVQTGFEADMTHVGIQGLCIKCQKEDAHG